ncbi:hypothetical protein ACFO0N_09890 [Halobium salinum]|uniref:DUF5602 domain-containing protein n=1 Tax=Halobium salinum TaxID=1364940 RepID=A0ABD5PBJ9_9EURY|nr:hypothetical protein [Halobium salinum]
MSPRGSASNGIGRRTALKAAGVSLLGVSLLSSPAAAAGRAKEHARLHWGEGVDLDGDGDVDLQTVARVCADGRPSYLGVYLSDEGLATFEPPTEGDHGEDGDGGHGEGEHVGASYWLDFPEVGDTPFTVMGFDWGPMGHPPGPWMTPHFDVHFYTIPEETVKGIGPGIAEYDIPDERMPEGYVTAGALGAPREIVPQMGEHLLDPTTPELGGAEFTHTLIWGVSDLDGDGVGEMTFVEPMITRKFLNGLKGTVRGDVALPEVVPEAGYYPTQYVMQRVPQYGGILISLTKFEWRDLAYPPESAGSDG